MINRIKLKLLCEALAKHDKLELLKSFHSNIQDCFHGGHLEYLQMTFALIPYI